ncbi:MAG: rRNA maturation RNase YbeY [Deltaproteobacteria bacterium]|nr:rRNA maturation RNase YbeY [Deltaproteobacteria bacterium]MBW2417244.1 rRNA maturation RNase YbeY [Deltaproteobacteria bacterium]
MSVRVAGPPSGRPGDRLDRVLLADRARRVLRALDHGRSELSVALVGDAEIAGLNEQYRGKPEPTDVLSFSLVEGDHSDYRGQLLGDVVISVDTAASQARKRHRSLDEEVARLLIHGVLHLLGHDHAEAEERRRMWAEQRRVWKALAR